MGASGCRRRTIEIRLGPTSARARSLRRCDRDRRFCAGWDAPGRWEAPQSRTALSGWDQVGVALPLGVVEMGLLAFPWRRRFVRSVVPLSLVVLLGGCNGWFTQFTSTDGTKQLTDISCPTTSTCFAVGSTQDSDALVEQSTDGGQTWKTLTSPQFAITFWSPYIDCPDTDHCVAVGGPRQIPGGTTYALFTSDGGATWSNSIVSTTGNDPSGLSCIGDSRCLATEEGNVTTYSQVDITTDGGSTWTASPKIEPTGPGITASDFGLSHIVCPSATECVAAAEEDYWTDTEPAPVLVAYDTFASSTDGGMTWQQLPLPNGGGAVACPGATHCLIASDQAVESATTTDGGVSWSIADDPVPGLDYSFRDISCPTTVKCIAVQFFSGSDADAVYTSADGGATWDSQPIATAFKSGTVELYSLSCPSAMSCWTIGFAPSSTGNEDGSIILHSVTGGVAWPSVGSISPTEGPVSGGTQVTIMGAGFFGSPMITFGSGPGTEMGTSVKVVSPTELEVTSPVWNGTPPPPGGVAVPVTVTESGLGSSPPNLNYEFTYVAS